MIGRPPTIPLLALQTEAADIPLTPEQDKGHITGLSTATLAIAPYGTIADYDPLPLHTLGGKYPVLNVAVLEQGQRLKARGIFRVMLNNLDPQTGDIGEHTDGQLPGNPTRYHLPIFTNQGVQYWEESLPQPIHLPEGYWAGPIDYTARHWILNKGRTRRLHLLVDYYQ